MSPVGKYGGRQMSHGMVLIRLPRGTPWLATCLCGWYGQQQYLFDARQEWIVHAGVTDPLLVEGVSE